MEVTPEQVIEPSSNYITTQSLTNTSTLRPAVNDHAFSRRKKNACVYIASLAAMLSPLSSNIYLSSTVTISKELKVPIHLIALTITIFMVVQGISPSFWGPLSDIKGRRLTLCCTLVVYLAANLALALTREYGTLLAFRGLQAGGGAATIAIASGIISDIANPVERGGMVGVSATIRQTAQVLGPVFGGLITHTFGFRAIFWFLTIVGGVVFIMIMVFLPETLPSIAGDGTVRLRGIHKPFFYRLKAQPSVYDEKSNIPTNPIRLQAFFSPILSLLQPDVFIIMFSGGIIYAIHNMVTSSTTALLKPRFGLTDQQTGLVFLPNGCGVILGSFIWGKILDRNWKFYEKDYRSTRGMMDTQTLDHSRLEDFPVERARLHWHWWLFSAFTAAVTAYGFSLSTKSLPFVLVLQSLIAITSQAVFTTCSALAIDLYPSAAASATALQNLVRCALGAVGVAVVDLMLARLGESLTYSLCGSLVLLLWPLLIVEWMHGSEWRQERLRRSREKAALADDAERKE